MVKPAFGYVYGEEIKIDSGVVTTSEASDTRQKYKVLAVGPGYMSDYGKFIVVPESFVGKTVYIQKHSAEGDSTPAMLAAGYALFPASRIMATEEDE